MFGAINNVHHLSARCIRVRNFLDQLTVTIDDLEDLKSVTGHFLLLVATVYVTII
jgi:hypothetical protein